MTRPVHPLVGWGLALLLASAGGFAEMVGTAVTHTPTTSLVPASGEGAGTSEASPWVAPRPAKASRSRQVAPRATGTRLSVTAYCETGNRTASGLWPREGMAAGNAWPFGTRLRVEGVGVVSVQDRYGWGTQLDLFMDSCAKARQFGRRHLHVAVVR